MLFKTVSEGAKLHRSAVPLLAAAAALLAGCATQGPTASYDPVTRRLVRLDSDLDGDGLIDHRAYMDGNLLLRAETDENGDGRVDRWEYYDRSARLLVVGASSETDGVEDTWTWVVDANGERRVDQSLLRDRVVDRREFFKDALLLRAEADTNGDGRVDRWEQFDGGNLLQAALDTTFRLARPNRRLAYDREGRFRHLEIDLDGDGNWEQLK